MKAITKTYLYTQLLLITKIEILYAASESRIRVTYNDEKTKILSLYKLILFLNIQEYIQPDVAKQIMNDSNKLIIQEEGYYSFNNEIACHFFQNNEQTQLFSNFDRHILEAQVEKIFWHEFDIHFNMIAKSAINMILNYPGQTLVSIGQSPAWLLKAVDMMPTECKTLYIPFSGHSHIPVLQDGSRDYDADEKKAVIYEIDKSITELYYSREIGYRQKLEEIGLSPNGIKDLGAKIIFMDFINTGSGLASFLSLFLRWGKELQIKHEDLLQKVDIVILNHDSLLKQMNVEGINIECEGFIASNLPFTDIITMLANGNDLGKLSDRLIPRYQHHDWGTPLDELENEEFIHHLSQKLGESVMEEYISYALSNIPHDRITATPEIVEIIGSYLPYTIDMV